MERQEEFSLSINSCYLVTLAFYKFIYIYWFVIEYRIGTNGNVGFKLKFQIALMSHSNFSGHDNNLDSKRRK